MVSSDQLVPPAPPARPPAPAARWQLPRIDPSERWVGGVAAAIARELGVQPLVIRASFALLALARGWGLAFYALAWVILAVAQPRQLAPYRPQPKAASPLHCYVAVAMIVAGLLVAVQGVGISFGPLNRVVLPVGLLLTGFLIAWTRQQDEGGTSAVVRIVAGVLVAVGGVVAFLFISADLVDAALVLLVTLAVVAGIGVVAAPSLARIGRELDQERQDRVRADERARVAAHLHDSVLQTLALIQRHADDPVRTAQLARQQERELRHWLYSGPSPAPGAPTRLGPALEAMAAEVDEAHGVPVVVVSVGDNAELPPAELEPLLAATREAVVNAAKHSGAAKVDVYAERRADTVEVYVRDTGKGFDPTVTPGDRRGLRESVLARMERAGGRAAIHSEPGAGTEVELILPLGRGRRPAPATATATATATTAPTNSDDEEATAG